MRVTRDWEKCQSTRSEAHMRLCSLKGKGEDPRVSYSSKVYVPKACMLLSPDVPLHPKSPDKGSADLPAAAVSKSDCHQIIADKPEDLGKFVTTTTTTTSPE